MAPPRFTRPAWTAKRLFAGRRGLWLPTPANGDAPPTPDAAAPNSGAPDSGAPDSGAQAPRRAPMSLALGVALGALVLFAVVSVMGVGIWSGYRNTMDLLGQKGEVMLSAAEMQTRQYLDTAENQVGFVSGMISSGEAVPGPDDAFTNLLSGALAAAPQIEAIFFVGADRNIVGAERDAAGAAPIFRRVGDDAMMAGALNAARATTQGGWDRLVWREEYGQGLLCYTRPVIVDGQFRGLLMAFISVRALSEFIAELETDFGNNAFVLYGQDQVLAHPLMAYGYPGLTGRNPLPRQSAFSDPVLGSMWEPGARSALASDIVAEAGGHAIAFAGETYGFLYREIDGYADRPLLIGTYFRASDLLAQVMRLKWALLACLGILLVSVAVAAATGRRIALPARRLAEGARRIQDLDLANVPHIPGSFFKEINDAAESFNAMRDGLAWFERYVPKTLVALLMQTQGAGAIESSEREVTVMFTDIVGFTALSEDLPAGEVAALLNRHFTLVAACIEAEGGTVDKYIGDSVMAIWGAPERHPDGAQRAARTALAIERALRRRQGKAPVYLRIGIHSGPVVVGNIGSPGRVNYTVVGDTVNTAQRLDELARDERAPEAEATILISGETARHLGDTVRLDYVGLRQVRGRSRLIDVYALSAKEREEAARRRPAA